MIGIKQSDGQLIFNPPPTHVISDQDTLMVIGPYDKINQLKQSSGIC